MRFFSRMTRDRFVSADTHRRNIENQTTMSPRTVVELHRIGVAMSAPLALEFFFYSDSASKGEALSRKLSSRGYSSECRPATDDTTLICITGWSVPVPIDAQSVVAWTSEMCEMGFEHDCQFDGWGTALPP